MAFVATLWQNLNQLRDKERRLNCLLLLHVASPLLYTVTSFPVMPAQRLAVPSPTLWEY